MFKYGSKKYNDYQRWYQKQESTRAYQLWRTKKRHSGNWSRRKLTFKAWRLKFPKQYRVLLREMAAADRNKARKRRRSAQKRAHKPELLKKQRNRCAICRRLFTKKNLPCKDHCHKTQKKRGLLCTNCNFGLGHFKDSPELLKRAVKYLRTYSSSRMRSRKQKDS